MYCTVLRSFVDAVRKKKIAEEIVSACFIPCYFLNFSFSPDRRFTTLNTTDRGSRVRAGVQPLSEFPPRRKEQRKRKSKRAKTKQPQSVGADGRKQSVQENLLPKGKNRRRCGDRWAPAAAAAAAPATNLLCRKSRQ